MRAYFAVIKDSFREALASRVLWILLLFSTLFLLAVAPLSLPEQHGTEFEVDSVFDWPGLVAKIKGQGASDEPSPGKRIWELLTDNVRQKLAGLPDIPTSDETPYELTLAVVEDLNRLLSDRSLYDEAAWRGIELEKNATDLIGRGVDKLSEDDVARLNRILLEMAFPFEIAHRTAGGVHLAYFGWKTKAPLSIARNQVTTIVNTSLTVFMSLFVGTLGVFAAILVTAPIIPQTFEAGAIDLLLSKPVSRSLLFLAKFLGGCAFIVLNAAYCVVGLWLIVGLRFEIWSGKLLLCIPLFMFLFAIYYAVSSLAGVIWRNAIVSVVISILFWAACFLVGQTKGIIEQFFINPYRIVKLVPAGDSLLGVNEQGHILEWREAERKWGRVLQTGSDPEPVGPFRLVPPTYGPIYDAANARVLAIRTAWAGGFRMTSADPTLLVGTHSEEWTGTVGPAPPKDTTGLFVDSRGEAVVLTRQAVVRVGGDLHTKPREFKLLGFKVPLGGRASHFTAAGPETPLRLTPPFAAAMDANSGALAVWNHGVLMLLEADEDGKYHRVREREFEVKQGAAVLAFAGSNLVVALADGHVWVLDPSDLSVRHDFQAEASTQPRFAEASPDGRWFAVIFHNQKLWLFDAREQTAKSFRFVGRSDISAAAFTGPNRLLLADRGTRVIEYDLEPFRTVSRRTPDLELLERVYRFAVLPIYTVFPKPGELDDMVSYLLTDKETESIGPDPDDLQTRHIKRNVKGPVWSGLGFTAIVLALTCFYIRRTDF